MPPEAALNPVSGRSANVLLVSCYELGHQPFTLASASARLESDGHAVSAVDASIDPPDDAAIDQASLIAISVPMHTALRLGSDLARRVRARNPRAHICLFGLYAWMNAPTLVGGVADSVIGGEFEESLARLVAAIGTASPIDVEGVTTADSLDVEGRVRPPVLERLRFLVPKRDDLPPLESYAKLVGPKEGQTTVAGYAEASRGCKHRCRHCPVTPVYDGRFFVVPEQVVLADVRQQVEAGARHITFGDPDFLNGVGHAMKIAQQLHAAHHRVTFDITTKIEHVLRYRRHFPELRDLGCIFVVSAVESLSDRVLVELDKGHTRADVLEALEILRAAKIELRPSLVSFTPWTTLDDYLDLLDFTFEHGLVENVDPIQLAIRLLVPPGSALLWPRSRRPGATDFEHRNPEPPDWVGRLSADDFSHDWRHPDPRMDALFSEVSQIVEQGTARKAANYETIVAVRNAAYSLAERVPPPIRPRTDHFVPRLTESWFCCAEPSRDQRKRMSAAIQED